MARKDVGLMMTAAKDQPLVGLPCIAKRMDELIKAGNGVIRRVRLRLEVVELGFAAGTSSRCPVSISRRQMSKSS